MPRYTVIQQPLQGEQIRMKNKHRRYQSEAQAIYVNQLRKVLSNTRKNTQQVNSRQNFQNQQQQNNRHKFNNRLNLKYATANVYSNTRNTNITSNNNHTNKFQTQRQDQNQEQNREHARPGLYVLDEKGNNVGEIVRLPKIKRRSKAHSKHIRYGDIDKDQKLIIRNYMNAKLIQLKNSPKKYKKKRRSQTIDKVDQLPQNPNRKIYKYHSSTPIQALNSFENNESRVREHSYRSQRINDLRNSNKGLAGSEPNGIDIGAQPARSIVVKTQGAYQNQSNKKLRKNFKNEDGFSNYTSKNENSRINNSNASINNRLNSNQYIMNYKDGNNSNSFNTNLNTVQNTSKVGGWQFVDPLSLQTYFVKMKRVNLSPQSSKMERTKLKIPAIPARQQMSKFIKNYIPEFDQIKIQQLIKYDSFQIIQDETLGVKTFYFGQTKNDRKHGKGIYINDKTLFEGIWGDQQKIRGIQVTQLGKFKGQFKDGMRNGKGQFFWSHGQYYQGQWKNGKKNGSGYWRSIKGESYMGQWKNGQVTGYGVHTMKNGQRYQGQFINFLKHGFGKQNFPNGDNYQGRYVQGQAHGKGKYQWKNGTIFQGQFVQGYRNGKGSIVSPNGLKFQGSFKNQIVSGQGKLQSGNGDVFNGLFQNNKKNGNGLLDMKSQKRIIKGFWVDNELVKENN